MCTEGFRAHREHRRDVGDGLPARDAKKDVRTEYSPLRASRTFRLSVSVHLRSLGAVPGFDACQRLEHASGDTDLLHPG